MTVEQFKSAALSRGVRQSTVTRAEYHLRDILRLEVNGSRNVTWLTKRGAELYSAYQAGRAVDTHRNGLSVAKQWGDFCRAKGWLPCNPFAEIKGQGRRKKGKPQLRRDEARQLAAWCLDHASDQGAIATVTLLCLGLRASELCNCDVRDLDDGASVLWIATSKTEAGKRQLEVPAFLRPALAALAALRGAGALFRDSDDERADRHWIGYHVRRCCAAAGVPVIPPHGLRGTHATLAAVVSGSSRAVAQSLGHTSHAMTERAYIDAGTVEQDRVARANALLGNFSSASGSQIEISKNRGGKP